MDKEYKYLALLFAALPIFWEASAYTSSCNKDANFVKYSIAISL